MAKFFSRFAEYPITHFFVIGFVLGILGKNPDKSFEIAGVSALLGGLFWYTAKAFLVTGHTVKNWDKLYPGEPMFKSGGLTEYDREFARQVGESAEKARRRYERETGHRA